MPPLHPGSSQKTVSANIRELHKGPQYAKTKRRHGKKVADRQAIAIAMEERRKSPKFY